MKKWITWLIVFAILLFAGCSDGKATPTTQQPTETSAPETAAAETTVVVENPIAVMYLSMYLDETEYRYINVMEDGQGGVAVEFMGSERKMTTLELAALHAVTVAVQESGLVELNGQNILDAGAQGCSVFIQYADGSMVAAACAGEVNEAFSAAYTYMERYFEALLKDVPVYVPRPLVEGEPDEALLQEMEAVMLASGIETLDAYMLSPAPEDETKADALGMSDVTHVVDSVICTAMMQPNPYGVVIVRVDSAENIPLVRKDLAENINWAKWICVRATDAIIAEKGDLVICLIGTGAAFGGTKAAIEGAGWVNAETFADR